MLRGLAAGGASRDWSSQHPLQAVDEVLVRQRPAYALGRSQCAERCLVSVASDQLGEPVDPLQHRRDAHQAIVLASQVCADAGPGPILCAVHKTRSNRVQGYISDGGHKVVLVHRHGRVSIIEKVTAPPAPRIDEMGPPLMRPADSPPHARFVPRRQDQMHVIGHKAVRPYLYPRLRHLLGEDIEIDLLITVLEEDGFAPVAARGDMMRTTWGDDTGDPGHA